MKNPPEADKCQMSNDGILSFKGIYKRQSAAIPSFVPPQADHSPITNLFFIQKTRNIERAAQALAPREHENYLISISSFRAFVIIFFFLVPAAQG